MPYYYGTVKGDFRKYANRRGNSFNAENNCRPNSEKAQKRQTRPHRTFPSSWFRRHLPSVVPAVLVEAGPSIYSRAIYRGHKAGHRRARPGYHREPRSLFRIDSPDLARSEIPGGSLRIADSFPGGFSGRPGSCQTPPVPRNLHSGKKQSAARHRSAGILHRVLVRLSRARAGRSLQGMRHWRVIFGLDVGKRPLSPNQDSGAREESLRTYVTLGGVLELPPQVFNPGASPFGNPIGKIAAPGVRISFE